MDLSPFAGVRTEGLGAKGLQEGKEKGMADAGGPWDEGSLGDNEKIEH